ncbi:MAG: sodium:calcium antiporter [Chloroflexi bacterium]|nr:sodium:calcium antiporter [Chloroflexota bacterium]
MALNQKSNKTKGEKAQQAGGTGKDWLWITGAAALALPAIYLRVSGTHTKPALDALLFGLAIVGAAFLLSWAAEAAQRDISQALALAFLALIAVLPEYAVDLYFAWTAGSKPEYVHYAVANMTGANRLLVGAGWALVVFLFWWRTKKRALALEKSHAVELSFLGLATLYAFTIPLKGTLSLIDSVVLVSLFVLYIWAASRAHHEEPELVGPSLTIGALPATWRRMTTIALFVYSALIIIASAEPFAEGLIASGKALKIDEFILVQWVAPLASEAPEIFVASIFTLRANAGAGMGTLISSKVNQWTLLIGTLPLVYGISLLTQGKPLSALPLDGRQVEEILLTTAQSAFAVAVLINLSISRREAAALFLLFALQLPFPDPHIRYGFSAVYILLTLILVVKDRQRLRGLLKIVPQVVGVVRSPSRQ